jgi:hypothetical protein
LERPVKALNVGIVVGTMEAGVSRGYVMGFELLLKVAPILWAIVRLYHGDSKAPRILCFQYGSRSQPWTELWHQDDVRHPGE